MARIISPNVTVTTTATPAPPSPFGTIVWQPFATRVTATFDSVAGYGAYRIEQIDPDTYAILASGPVIHVSYAGGVNPNQVCEILGLNPSTVYHFHLAGTDGQSSSDLFS